MGITASKATIDVEQHPSTIASQKIETKSTKCNRAVQLQPPHAQPKKLLRPLWLQQKTGEKSSPTSGEPRPSKPKPQHLKVRGKKKQNLASISRKKNAKYKKVTKSIIGRPTNFQHVGYNARDRGGYDARKRLVAADDQAISLQLLNIAERLDAPAPPASSLSPSKNKIRSSRQNDPPPLPPLHWSTLALRRAKLLQSSRTETIILKDVAYPSTCPEQRAYIASPNRRPKNTAKRCKKHIPSDAFEMPPSLRLGPAR